MKYREENDSLGGVKVPAEAYYGAQTQRAVENFAISGWTLPALLLQALALIKRHAARVNADLGLLAVEPAAAIVQAAEEMAAGRFDDQFVVDVFQTGSGTSTHMNVNEVLAARANELLTGRRVVKGLVHPNDHVNLGQSSNDVIPTALHLAAVESVQKRLLPALKTLKRVLDEKAGAFQDVRKLGRTHLQDAVPITLGQEFSGYSRQITVNLERLQDARERLLELALGGTAVGTGINTHPRFAAAVIAAIAAETGLAFREAENHFAAQAAQDAPVELSGVLKTIAVSLTKIANDLRWLASGPRCGIGEIELPALQPGSSIMPGKINPVIPEAVLQVAAQVIGNDLTITLAGQGGNFELNVMLPVMAFNLLQSIDLLAAGAESLALKCIQGITANRRRCAAAIENSLALATRLVPDIGYERAAQIALKAYNDEKTVLAVALEEGILPAEKLKSLLSDANDNSKQGRKDDEL